VQPDAPRAAAGAGEAALRVGALGRLENLVNGSGGEALWEESGNLADEFKNSDFQNSRQDIDQRSMTTNNAIIAANAGAYASTQQTRGFLRDAIAAMRQYLPANTADLGELYVAHRLSLVRLA